MKKILISLFICMPLMVVSQDLTGTWEGSGGGTTYIKMVIRHTGDSLIGYTYDEGEGYCKATFAGHYNEPRKRLVGRGVKMIARTPNHVLVDYDLLYSKNERGEFLRENIGEDGFLERILGSNDRLYLKRTSTKVDLPQKPMPPAKQSKNIPFIIKKAPVVQKPAPVIAKKIPIKKRPDVILKPARVSKPSKRIFEDTLVKVPVPDKVSKVISPAVLLKKKDERSSKLVETIYTSSDTIKMFVYDNGEVDGDTVTVFMDNALILDRFPISEKAKELTLPISRNGIHFIELYANNLGSIPPNTALIIIVAGKKRYELHASYDFKTNAKIIIQYKK